MMMTVTQTTTDAGLATALRISVSRLARRLRAQREASGLTEAVLSETQLAALSALERHQAMTPGELADHEKVQPASSPCSRSAGWWSGRRTRPTGGRSS
jgi:hypothetical protein